MIHAAEAAESVAHPEMHGEARDSSRMTAVSTAYAVGSREGVERVDAAEQQAQARLLRDVFGLLPFRPVTISPSLLEWRDKTIVRLAQAAYHNRQLPAGTLEPERLMVLADALEDAGCRDQEVLAHLREQGRVHVRGCHVVDLILGKS